jgi:REP element-mobilizing transposase RayT
MDLQREYLSKNHAKYLLKHHVILVCKHRRKALVGNVSQETIQRYIENQG